MPENDSNKALTTICIFLLFEINRKGLKTLKTTKDYKLKFNY